MIGRQIFYEAASSRAFCDIQGNAAAHLLFVNAFLATFACALTRRSAGFGKNHGCEEASLDSNSALSGLAKAEGRYVKPRHVVAVD